MKFANWIIASAWACAWAGAAIPSAWAGAPSGCGCDVGTYQRELRQVRELLSATWHGTTDEAIATGWAWGINPCAAGPTSTPARYAWFDSNESKCHDHCMANPWTYQKDSWDSCLHGNRSFCGPKASAAAAGNAVHFNCMSHGTSREACQADPFCEVKEVPEAESRCEATHGHFYEGGHCYSDTCARVTTCTPEWTLHCTVNCNDCQDLTKSAIDHAHFECFTTEKLESYYIHGNEGKPGRLLDGHITAGTHSMVKLVPKPGSVAELMAPLGIVADALEGTKLRRITATRPVKGSSTEVDRERITLTPNDRDDFSQPLETLPYQLGLGGNGQIELSSGCKAVLPSEPASRSQILSGMSTSLLSYYQLLQADACRGDGSASSERAAALAKIRATTAQFSAGMARIGD